MSTVKFHKVKSRSQDDVVHTVTAVDNGLAIECDCQAYQFKKRCAHCDFIIKKFYTKK